MDTNKTSKETEMEITITQINEIMDRHEAACPPADDTNLSCRDALDRQTAMEDELDALGDWEAVLETQVA
jgi:hypothetical protein